MQSNYIIVPIYEDVTGQYILVEGYKRPLDLAVIAQKHGAIKDGYFDQPFTSTNAIGEFKISVLNRSTSGSIKEDNPTEIVLFAKSKTVFLVTQILEFFDAYMPSGIATTNSEGERYEMYITNPNPLQVAPNQSYERVVVFDTIENIMFNEWEITDGTRKMYIDAKEVGWFKKPSDNILSQKKLL